MRWICEEVETSDTFWKTKDITWKCSCDWKSDCLFTHASNLWDVVP